MITNERGEWFLYLDAWGVITRSLPMGSWVVVFWNVKLSPLPSWTKQRERGQGAGPSSGWGAALT